MEEAKRTMREILIGLFLWGIVITVPGVLIAGNPLAYFLGVLAGCLVAMGLLFHMYRHLDIALDMDRKSASGHMMRSAMIRTVVMALAVGGSFYFGKYVHPAGVILGLWGMKIAAYLQPVIHRYMGGFSHR